MSRDLYDPLPASAEQTDEHQQTYDYGEGGVPWYLLLLYLGFLTFFTYYTLEYQLPDFTDEPPVAVEEGAAAGGGDDATPQEND